MFEMVHSYVKRTLFPLFKLTNLGKVSHVQSW